MDCAPINPFSSQIATTWVTSIGRPLYRTLLRAFDGKFPKPGSSCRTDILMCRSSTPLPALRPYEDPSPQPLSCHSSRQSGHSGEALQSRHVQYLVGTSRSSASSVHHTLCTHDPCTAGKTSQLGATLQTDDHHHKSSQSHRPHTKLP